MRSSAQNRQFCDPTHGDKAVREKRLFGLTMFRQSFKWRGMKRYHKIKNGQNSIHCVKQSESGRLITTRSKATATTIRKDRTTLSAYVMESSFVAILLPNVAAVRAMPRTSIANKGVPVLLVKSKLRLACVSSLIISVIIWPKQSSVPAPTASMEPVSLTRKPFQILISTVIRWQPSFSIYVTDASATTSTQEESVFYPKSSSHPVCHQSRNIYS